MLVLRDSNGSHLVVAPECGGGIVGWTHGSTPLLRDVQPAAIGLDPLAMGCFPLVPFANRIANARFQWGGCEHRISRNFGEGPHAIHGIGWQRPWRVESISDTYARLSLDHTGQGEHARAWPFAFHAELEYALNDDGLCVSLSATNCHHGPAPIGLGLHPHFPRTGGATLRFEANGVWINTPDTLPREHVPLPRDRDHARGRAVVDEPLDNCFTGWASIAELAAGPASLTLKASGIFANLQVFTPSWGDFYCVEPVSHVPDAINRPGLSPDQALHVLAPGETLAGTIDLLLAASTAAIRTGRRT